MLSCLVDSMSPSVHNYDWSSSAKCTLPTVRLKCLDGYKISTSRIYPAAKETLVDKTGFLKGLGLAPTQPSDKQKVPSKQLSVDVDYNVIVIEDDDEEDDASGMDSSMNSGQDTHGSQSVQPSTRLRKLLAIDVSSPLGLRMLGYVMSALKNDSNPYTVSHSLSGSEFSLDYGTFCRTPVKGSFSGRLRHRGFPVKFRRSPYAGMHYHYYCFGRSDRAKFCRRFDTGLSGRSRRLRDKCGQCAVVIEKLTRNEVGDWRSSQRLRDYVERMRRKDAADSVVSSQTTDNSDGIICLSSDSEDEALSSVADSQDLMFRCHQCDVKLPCSGRFRALVRDHYSTCHGISNIDIIQIPQPDGTTAMQIVHVPTMINSAYSSVSGTGTPLSDESFSSQCLNASRLYIPQPDDAPPVLPRIGNLANGFQCDRVGGNPVPRQLFSNNYARGDPGADLLTPQSVVCMLPPHSGSAPLLQPIRRKFSATPAILRRRVLCSGGMSIAAARSYSDTDVICLD